MTVERSKAEVTSHFVRHRNAMVCYGDFGPIFEDHYLHLMQLDVRLDPDQDALLKDALACLTLTLLSRPQNEALAWTINFRDPPLNLFVTGDSQLNNVVGRVFTENVKVPEKTLFYCQITRPGNPTRQSTVEVESRDILRIVEEYYRQSEQFPARLFRQGGDAYAMVVAHPDIDLPWFEGLTAESVRTLAQDEELGLLEIRGYHFACGCDIGIILSVLVRAFGDDPQTIFAGESMVQVNCPRCGGVFNVDPPTLEAFLEARKADESSDS